MSPLCCWGSGDVFEFALKCLWAYLRGSVAVVLLWFACKILSK